MAKNPMAKRKRGKKLILPNRDIVLPETPHERRMRLPFTASPPKHSDAGQALQRAMDTDIQFQLMLKRMQKLRPHIASSRVNGGSGMRMSKLLRGYFLEYLDRFDRYGPESLPMSFNVVEAFLKFRQQDMLFDLREEVEHLLSLDDYFDWYSQKEFPLKPTLLIDLLQEGKVYSYEMANNKSGYRLGGESQKIIVGVSFVRHANELSCMMLAGENPPLLEDGAIFEAVMETPAIDGKKEIELDTKRSIEERYLGGFPGYAKAIVLTRFDLSAEKHDVRYVNLDDGPAYSVFTDDKAAFECMEDDAANYQLHGIKMLQRYESLFSVLTSLIFLPAFLVRESNNIETVKLTTTLGAKSTEEGFKSAIVALGERNCQLQREVKCLPKIAKQQSGVATRITPPPMEFKCDGYWIAIGSNEVGADKQGKPIFGQTWIQENGVLSAPGPLPFNLERTDATRRPLDIKLDNESKERALVAEAMMIIALAGHIGREITVSDHGIDMEVEFKDLITKEATGRKVYLQLKSGDSHLRLRKSDGKQMFQIKKQRYVRYWMAQQFPVILIVKNADGNNRWMEIGSWLKENAKTNKSPITQIEFDGKAFDSEAVNGWMKL